MIDAFVAQMRDNACLVHGPVAAADLAGLLVARVRGRGLVAVNTDDALPGDLFHGTGVEVLRPGDADWRERLPHAAVGVTGAPVAVAEPAALGLVCGPGAPRATSLVPPLHVCVLRTADIVATLADALARVAAAGLPSALTWIGGPSRTGDLEMVLTLGVHGPREVEVVLVA